MGGRWAVRDAAGSGGGGCPAIGSWWRVLTPQGAAGRLGTGHGTSCCSRRVLAKARRRALPCKLNVNFMCSSKLKNPKYCCR